MVTCQDVRTWLLMQRGLAAWAWDKEKAVVCYHVCTVFKASFFVCLFVLWKEEKVTKQTEILDYYCCIRATLSEISLIFRLSCKFIRLFICSPHAECVVGFGGRKISMKRKLKLAELWIWTDTRILPATFGRSLIFTSSTRLTYPE